MRRFTALLAILTVALAACGGSSSAPATDDPVESGRRVYQSHCAVCHGRGGEGIVGPALDAVTETFPSCDDQIHWIRLGSEAWKEQVGPVYGAQDTPIERVMPGFDDALSDRQIRLAAIFERSQFGGAEARSTVEACGLQAAEVGE